MKQRCTRILLTSLLFANIVFAAHARHPHLSGDIYLSVKEGIFKADFEISGLPELADYAILLNSGMNIRFVRDSADTVDFPVSKTYDPERFAESFCYFFEGADGKRMPLPGRFRISYGGAFPVHNDTARRSAYGDWKGNIAFNGNTLRAAESAAWYPVLYDRQNDRLYQEVSYNITVHAPDAKAVYLNGTPPQYGQNINFRSERPFPLLLFAGNFEFHKKYDSYLVNTPLTDTQSEVLSDWMLRIRKYYETKLQISYGIPVTLLADSPVSRFNNWLFVTYPTIASISPNNWLKTLVDEEKRALVDSSSLSFLAHEIGHYYFGSVLEPNSSLRWVFLEGMAEYISLQALRDLAGETFYKRKLRQYRANVKGRKLIPLGKLQTPAETDEVYRYSYVPLLLTALENETGKEQVWKWLKTVLNSPNPTTDYEFFRQSLLLSGVGKEAFDNFANRYLLPDTSLQNTLSLFNSDVRDIYYWGLSKEPAKPGAAAKPAALYSSVRKMRVNDVQLAQLSEKYHTYVKNNCAAGSTSDFNTYETLESAMQARTRWLQKLTTNYTLKEIPF